MKKLFLAALTGCLSVIGFAQNTWQWAKIGGSQYSWQGGPLNPVDEEMRSMATDPNGNLYVLSRAANKVYMGGDSSLTTDNMFVLTSWACDGSLRWIKSIGPSFDRSIATDTLGGVYLTGFMNVSGGGYFDADTVIPAQGNDVLNGNFIIKYNTNGALQWLHMPDPLVVTLQSYDNKPYYTHMQVEPDGTVHNFTYLPAGTYENGVYSVAADGYHVLKYDKDGNFLGGTPMPIKMAYDINGAPMISVYDQCRFTIDPKLGRYYLGGTVITGSPLYDVMIGSDTFASEMWPKIFISCFDYAGNVKWSRCQDSANNGNLMSTAIGPDGNVYISGQIFNNSAWNGTMISNPDPLLGIMAFASCMDTNGVNKWVSTGYSTSFGPQIASTIAVSEDNIVRVTGVASDANTWGSFHLVAPPAPGCTMQTGGIFFASLDPANGNCIALDSARTVCGNSAEAYCTVTDRHGNFYLGGMIRNPSTIVDTVMKIGNDHLVAIGGDTDFFIAKFGYASCAPLAQSIATAATLKNLTLFPNPASDRINLIGNNDVLQYSIYNSIGAIVATGRLTGNTAMIDIASFTAGFYYLQVTNNHSERATFKFIKK